MYLRIPAAALSALALIGCGGDGAISHVAALELDVTGLVLGDDDSDGHAGMAGLVCAFDARTGEIAADWYPGSSAPRVEDVDEGDGPGEGDETLLLLDPQTAWIGGGAGRLGEPWRFHAVAGGRLIDGGAALVTGDEAGGCQLHWVGDWGRVPGAELPAEACLLGETAGGADGLFVAAGDALVRSDREGFELLDAPASLLASDAERIYAAGDGLLQALDLDGAPLWQTALDAELVDLDVAEGAGWVIAHALTERGGVLLAYDAQTGAPAARAEVPVAGREISAGGESVALALPGELHVFSLTP